MLRLLLLSAAALTLGALPGLATTPEPPSLKPGARLTSANSGAAAAAPAAPIANLSPAAMMVTDAFAAAARNEWSQLAQMETRAPDPLVRSVILWKRASEGAPDMSFTELHYAMNALSDWPLTGRMRGFAEEKIEGSRMPARERIDWLETAGPRTAAGRIALANAYREAGEREKSNDIIRAVWRGNTLDEALSRRVLSQYGGVLTQEDHRTRADFLLWTGQRREATALKSQLSPDWRALVDARLALASRARNIDATVNAVPGHLQSHPGLLHDRARWRRGSRMQDGATELLVQIDGQEVHPSGRAALWRERAIAVREELKNRNYARAYRLTAPHGMSSGQQFAEAEWLAGWIALRLQGDAARGLGHFETMTAGVRAPVSQARGLYWTGRARDALGREADALTAYSAAAQYKFTYYGQLSAERVADRRIDFGQRPRLEPEAAAAFEARPVIAAARLLAEAREAEAFRAFANHLNDTLEDPAELEDIAELAHGLNLPEVAVRVGKGGLQRGVIAPEAAFPVLMHPLSRQPQVERAMILAITRQESEFNPRATSRVGARGLMQFMPATARNEARLRGMPYQRDWLINDPAYNMTLGGLHLDTLLDQFGGSYIMTAAAYNAGPSRPGQWARDYGDPRTGQIDPIDWVEFVPFSETRNYIQRVLENVQVYRHRLSGQPEDIRLSEDLRRGRR